jgi:hypothetical protein
MPHKRLSPMGGSWARAHGVMASDGWLLGDLFFLQDAIAKGMSVAEVAAFLGRTVDEVRAKLKLPDSDTQAAEW